MILLGRQKNHPGGSPRLLTSPVKSITLSNLPSVLHVDQDISLFARHLHSNMLFHPQKIQFHLLLPLHSKTKDKTMRLNGGRDGAEEQNETRR